MRLFNLRKFLLIALLCTPSILLQALASHWDGIARDKYAVVTKEVVDLFIHLPLQQNPPYSPLGSPQDGKCRRAHQILKHEVVKVIGREGPLVNIACLNLIYGFDEKTQEPLSSFWVHENNVRMLSDCSEEQLATIPVPLYMDVRANTTQCKRVASKRGRSLHSHAKSNTVVLKLPCDGHSLGVRFMRSAEADTTSSYGTVVFDDATQKIHTYMIPHACACVEQKNDHLRASRCHYKEVIRDFVAFLRALPEGTALAYTWGGSSSVKPVIRSFYADASVGGWMRPLDETEQSTTEQAPLSGYDCSELVLRLAQVSGLKYLYKTTAVLGKCGIELSPSEKLQEGDLIVIPGHVMIVSDLEKHELLHARGYSAGCGIVCVQSLGSLFVDSLGNPIDTYAKLEATVRQKCPLAMLKTDGSWHTNIDSIKLMSMTKTCKHMIEI